MKERGINTKTRQSTVVIKTQWERNNEAVKRGTKLTRTTKWNKTRDSVCGKEAQGEQEGKNWARTKSNIPHKKGDKFEGGISEWEEMRATIYHGYDFLSSRSHPWSPNYSLRLTRPLAWNEPSPNEAATGQPSTSLTKISFSRQPYIFKTAFFFYYSFRYSRCKHSSPPRLHCWRKPFSTVSWFSFKMTVITINRTLNDGNYYTQDLLKIC